MIQYDTFYITTVVRFDYPAGTVVVRQSTHDYGLANDDTNHTGIKHVSVTALDEKGGFTIPEKYLTYVGPVSLPMSEMSEISKLILELKRNIDPEQKEPEPQVIDGKKVRPYDEWYQPPSVGSSALLFYGELFYRTSPVEKIDGTTVHTKNTVYMRETA